MPNVPIPDEPWVEEVFGLPDDDTFVVRINQALDEYHHLFIREDGEYHTPETWYEMVRAINPIYVEALGVNAGVLESLLTFRKETGSISDERYAGAAWLDGVTFGAILAKQMIQSATVDVEVPDTPGDVDG